MPEQITIKVNGTPLKQEVIVDLEDLVVDTSVDLPAMLSLTLNDNLDSKSQSFNYIDAENFPLGGDISVEVKTDELEYSRGTVSSKLFSGAIAAVEPQFLDRGRALLRIRAYDNGIKLTRGQKTRVFGDGNPKGSGISEGDIIKKVIQEAGLSATVDSSLNSVKYYYVLQYNQTNMEFLWSRARLHGMEIKVQDKKVICGKPGVGTASKAAVLEWGKNLMRFEPRLSVMHQFNTSEVRSWDVDKKQPLIGKATSPVKFATAKATSKTGGAEAQSTLKGQADLYIIDQPLATTDIAKQRAQALLDETQGTFVQAEGETRIADPRLIAGEMLTIKGVGKKYSGDYYITEARHVYNNGIYSVSFTASGRTPNTFYHLLLGPRAGLENGRIHGVVPALVTNNKDPDKLGRIKVKFPTLPPIGGAELESPWARLAVPMSGNQYGLLFTPEVNDEVLVAFENGDPNAPYVVGFLWNGKDKPPAGTAEIVGSDGKVNQRLIRSRSGHMIVLDDTDKAEQIIIQDKTGKNKIVINSKENTLTIDVEKDYKLVTKGITSIESSGAMTLKSNAKVTIDCQDFEVKAKASAKMEANSGINLKTSAALSAEGAQTTLKGSAMLQVDGGAMTEIKGGLVKIN